MDQKGITWVGNVYQRFEDMCLDVEEVIYQDTLNYVENQFQSVGESVRQFYSTVVQDFLPVNSLESDQDSVDGVGKKTNPAKNKPSKDKREIEVNSDSVEDASIAPPLVRVRRDVNNSCRPSGETITRAGLRSRKLRGQAKYNCISDLSKDEKRGKEKEVSTENSQASSDFVNKVHESLNDQNAKFTSAVDKDTGPEPTLEKCVETKSPCEFMADVSNDSQSSNQIILSESLGLEIFHQDKSGSESIPDLSIDFQSSNEVVLAESVGYSENEIGVSSSSDVLAQSNDVLNDGIASIGGSGQDEEVRYDNYADELIAMSQLNQSTKSFDWNLTTVIKTATEPEAEILQKSGRSKLEETIILVNQSDLPFLTKTESKKISNKKKIRESLYSRMRSGRIHEYKQLALQHGDGGNMKKISVEALMPKNITKDNSKKLPTHDSSESEWEIL